MASLVTLPADTITNRELRFERMLAAPIETVWAYLVDPELRKLWFMGGETGSAPGQEIEMIMDHRNLSDADIPTPERYAPYIGKRWAEKILRIEPPRLLSFSWDNGDAGTVTIELDPAEAGTRLTLTHSGLRGRADALNFGGGWHSHLAVLEKRLAGEGVPNFWALHAKAESLVTDRLGGPK